ncbi:homeobox protein cut-like 1 [Striga asiatica]|uniref:Homeobox protein cut-like 1 n=1 Tax=Striga asiatica TaxID=4170 RepID=A0A5A7PBK8_STRAF|nr:homeobox protein cut-like 1 [Striga asiatica]
MENVGRPVQYRSRRRKPGPGRSSARRVPGPRPLTALFRRAHIPPPRVHHGLERRALGLRPDRRFPPEVRVHKQDPGDFHARALRPGSHRHVVADVGPGAVTGEEDPAQVGRVPDPVVGPDRDPPEGGPGVVVGRREGGLRGAAVVDGDEEDAGLPDEGVEHVVVDGVGGGGDAEGAAVEVDDEGEAAGEGAGGAVEAGPDAGIRREDDVLGGDAGGGVGVCRRSSLGAEEALDGAVVVSAQLVHSVVGLS